MDDWNERLFAMQMFDSPSRSYTVAGCLVFQIPNAEKKYPDFLAWWMEAGKRDSKAELAREFGISRDTLYRYVPVKKRQAGKLGK